MTITNDFNINGKTIRFKNDEYPLSKIKGARVKTNTLKDHALRVLFTGLIVASVVWIICPVYFGPFTAPIAIGIGMVLALFSVRKYELQIQFLHIDETGLQWISIAKTNNPSNKMLFEEQVNLILKSIT